MLEQIKDKIRAVTLLFLLAANISCNPFAPAYDELGLVDNNLLGDRTSVDGLFNFFRNAYELRDTNLYGRLFSNDFTFTYYDFEQNTPVSWDRARELNSAFNLFRNTRQITLDWNYYVQLDTTLTEAAVIRNFNLNILQNDNTLYTGTGRARIKMRRSTGKDPWVIYYWFDDSDF